MNSKRFQQATQAGAPAQTIEEKFIRLDGSTVDVEVTAGSFMMNGIPTMQMIARDITKCKEVEEELRRNEDRMRLEEEMIAAFSDVRLSGFIHKPYKIDVLMEWVQRSLSE